MTKKVKLHKKSVKPKKIDSPPKERDDISGHDEAIA